MAQIEASETRYNYSSKSALRIATSVVNSAMDVVKSSRIGRLPDEMLAQKATIPQVVKAVYALELAATPNGSSESCMSLFHCREAIKTYLANSEDVHGELEDIKNFVLDPLVRLTKASADGFTQEDMKSFVITNILD